MHDDKGGLVEDLARIEQLQQKQRRRLLALLAGAGGMVSLGMTGCGGGSSGGSTSSSGSSSGTSTGTGSSGGSTGTTTSGSCSVIPNETEGPYPGDGSNAANGSVANALALSGIVRSDIRTSISPASGTATGVPLTVTLKLVSTSSACAALDGYAIYIWHCDAQGRYSLYSSGVTAENYLRGVQSTGGDGTVTFTTVFPGCYAGRVPHIHFEIYLNAGMATSYAHKLNTSQLALPLDTCATVYADSRYPGSAANLRNIGFASDGVFADGVTTQLATVTGNVADGYAATLTVGI